MLLFLDDVLISRHQYKHRSKEINQHEEVDYEGQGPSNLGAKHAYWLLLVGIAVASEEVDSDGGLEVVDVLEAATK